MWGTSRRTPPHRTALRRKKQNFVKNSLRVFDEGSVSKLWDYMDGVKSDMTRKEKEASTATATATATVTVTTTEKVENVTPAEEIKLADAKPVENTKKGVWMWAWVWV